MPMLETGKKTAGYTLLEVVAVITLIGLILALAYPNINLSVERVEIGYIGKLIKTDVNQLKDESLIDPSQEMVMTFTKDGYFFKIGEHDITRSFKYQFAFDLPKSELKEAQSNSDESLKTESKPIMVEPDKAPATPNPAKINPQEDNQEHQESQANDDQMKKAIESYVIEVINGELAENLKLNWQTAHFQGSLLLEKDGMVEWGYGKK